MFSGVHNLMKKHKRIENEIQSHEKRIEAVKPIADEIVKEQTTGWETVPGRIEQLDQAWSELLECSKQRWYILLKIHYTIKIGGSLMRESFVSYSELIIKSNERSEDCYEVLVIFLRKILTICSGLNLLFMV